MLEENFGHALVLAEGRISVFFTHPISLTFLLMTFFLLGASGFKFIKKRLPPN